MKFLTTATMDYPLDLVSNETDRAHRWNPAFDLTHPVGKCWLGRNDEVWPRRVTIVFHVPQQRDGLQSLAQTLNSSGIKTHTRKYMLNSLQLYNDTLDLLNNNKILQISAHSELC